MRIIKYLFCILLFITLGTRLSAQVEGKLILLPDNKTYQVSVISQTTLNASFSITNSAQITLTATSGGFELTRLRGVTGDWRVSGFAKAPIENTSSDYFSIQLSSPLQDIMYTAGEEIVLFTFENSADCVGSISIIDDNSDPFLPPNSQFLNVGNLFTIRGVGPINAYQGSLFPTASCPDALDATASSTVGVLSCPDDVTTMVVNINGGDSPFTIIATNTSTGKVDTVVSEQVNTPITLENITGGEYSIEIFDGKNTNVVLTEIVDAPEPIAFDLAVTYVNCEASQDGAIEITSINRTGDIKYEWSNGVTSTTAITRLDPATYAVTVTDENGCVATQEVVLKMDGWIEMNATPTDISCFGMNDGAISMETTGKNPPFTYEWDNGITTGTGDNLTGLTGGDYTVTVTDATGVCNQVTNLTIVEPDEVTALAFVDSSSLCELETSSVVTIDGVLNTRGAVTYSADGINFSNSNLFLLDAGESYTLTVEDASGCGTDIEVTLPEASGLSVELPNDLILNLGDNLQLDAEYAASSNVNFSWSPAEGLSCEDCPNPEVTPTSTTTYTLTVSDDNGCIKTASVIVYLSNTRRVYAPNVFSPNGDGQNDIYTVFAGAEALSINKLQIFSRWGELVYETSINSLSGGPDQVISGQLNHGWDGTIDGQIAPNGVYVFLTEITFIDGKTEVFSGEVTLTR